MWILYALISALFAGLVAVFGKLGLKNIDSILATTVRSFIMAGFLGVTALALKKFQGFSLSTFTGREWVYIALSGVAGALSWLFYFVALKNGTAVTVSAIDRLSIVFVLVFAALFLGEGVTLWKVVGVLCIALGAFLTTLK